MEIRQTTSRDNLPLTYYVMGQGEETLVIANAPGMSIKVMLPLMNQLQSHLRIIAFEYRGYPGTEHVLTEEQGQFSHYADDIEDILQTEQTEKVHMLSWCFGNKVALEFYRRHPEQVLTYNGLNISIGTPEKEEISPFGRMFMSMAERIMAKPDDITKVTSLMRLATQVPGQELFGLLATEEEDSVLVELYDYINDQSNLASTTLSLLETETGLFNYMPLFAAFLLEDMTEPLKAVTAPTLVMSGDRDEIAPLRDWHKTIYDNNEHIRLVILEDSSHYSLLEYPQKVAGLMLNHIAEHRQ